MPPDYDTYIVCGSPRSGTTLLQALLSSAEGANDVIPECSYLTALVTAYDHGLQKWQETYFYFDSPEHYESYNKHLIGQFVDGIWARVNRPRKLVLKNCAISKVAPTLAALFPGFRFAVVVRDPRGVIASRLEVNSRRDPASPRTDDDVRYACGQYVDYYNPLVAAAEKLKGRMFWIAYEDIAADRRMDELATFMGSPLRREKLWSGAELGFLPEWLTELYHRPPVASSVKKHEKTLEPQHLAIVEDLTVSLYARLRQLTGTSP